MNENIVGSDASVHGLRPKNQPTMGYSHLAGKKYWIISRVVEVITSQSNEIYHEWPKATSDKFITLTSDYLNHE